ncbi:MAG: dihydroorotase [Cellvibrionales bacterium]|nr:dihydroorotase [Cellvibrionales bacterium]|tara:strand:+ start:3613 stop:4659 length:1047 start_codon:yes stop_codon:yes gene_type:complete
MTSKTILTLTQPDDWHIHLRDGDALRRTANDAAKQFNRVIVMPNLVPPVTNAVEAETYRNRIVAAVDKHLSLDPLMVLYLTDLTTAAAIEAAQASGVVYAAKLYPAGATTNSESGVTDIKKIYPALEAMQKTGMVLAIHGEVTHSDVDIFDREALFIETILKQVVSDFPALRIVFEHITTEQAVEFVKASSDNIVATITAHHLLYNRNDMLAGGIRPHYYCLPILKRQNHQEALLKAATSGNKKFFLGTDSAPHTQSNKESACGCAGAYTAHAAIELYAEAFESMNALDKLEGFASFYGADFYRLPRNTGTITLEKSNWQVPAHLPMADGQLIPLRAGQNILWRLTTE